MRLTGLRDVWMLLKGIPFISWLGRGDLKNRLFEYLDSAKQEKFLKNFTSSMKTSWTTWGLHISTRDVNTTIQASGRMQFTPMNAKLHFVQIQSKN